MNSPPARLAVAAELEELVFAGLRTVGRADPRIDRGSHGKTAYHHPVRTPGVVLGPLAGAVLGELSVHRRWGRAVGVGVAAWIGFLIGTVVKVGLRS